MTLRSTITLEREEFVNAPLLFKYGPWALVLGGLVLCAATLWAGQWRVNEGREGEYEKAFRTTQTVAEAASKNVSLRLRELSQVGHHVQSLEAASSNAKPLAESFDHDLGLGARRLHAFAFDTNRKITASTRDAAGLQQTASEVLATFLRSSQVAGDLHVAESVRVEAGVLVPVVLKLSNPVKTTHLVFLVSAAELHELAARALGSFEGIVELQDPAGRSLLPATGGAAQLSNGAPPVRNTQEAMASPLDFASTRFLSSSPVKGPEGVVTVAGVRESAMLAEFKNRVSATWLIIGSALTFMMAMMGLTSFGLYKFAVKEAYLRRLATVDILTGLPNRRSFHNLLDAAVARSVRRGRAMALLFIDLDNFKYVNDSLGHAAGDELLKHVGAVLKSTLRSEDRVCRLAGDEFTVISGELFCPDDARNIAHRLLDALSAPFMLNGVELNIKASIGVALLPMQAKDSAELMRFADTAMYRAKQDCKGTVVVYNESMAEQALAQAQAVRELERAIKSEELFLVYQPKYDLERGELSGHEALVRWAHPARGTVFPGEFIHLAESSGLIGDLGNWALRRAVRQIREWHEQGHGWQKVAVNVSALQLKNRDFVDIVKRALHENGVSGKLLHLELTESSLAKDVPLVQGIIRELKQLGVCFAIDDFGTGYSSLGTLQQFDIDFLKVDRSFVNAIQTEAGEEICRAVVSLGHALKMKVVAEGVETHEQAVALARLGCDLAQGYLYAKPLPADKAVQSLRVEVPTTQEMRPRLVAV
jgi:diguanylate cyclase (GGDEF)-like protein